MASLITPTEQAIILSIFEASFDTWSRSVTIYKDPLKQIATPVPTTTNNPFGFGDTQQDTVYTFVNPVTGVFPAIIRDSDIENTKAQVAGTQLSPEIVARIIASPVSMKVRKNCRDFIEEGPTERIVDNIRGDTYLINGSCCLQTYQGSEYYIYPLRKTS
jgi:hypothetical protein